MLTSEPPGLLLQCHHTGFEQILGQLHSVLCVMGVVVCVCMEGGMMEDYIYFYEEHIYTVVCTFLADSL